MVALVTGGAKGIGREIVKELVKEGYKVAFCYNQSETEAMKLCSDLNGNSSLNCIGIKCDVRNYEEVKKFVDEATKVFGEVDVLVNNAGIANFNLLMDLDIKDWRNIMATNLDSVFYMCKECIPHMLSNGGSIINISSIWGIYGASNEVAYSTSKAGVIGLTKGLAQEVGGANIRVNCIAAGVINTDMNKCVDKDIMAELVDKTPLMRIGEPKEIADAVVFLASEKAKFITGQVIEIAGGFR